MASDRIVAAVSQRNCTLGAVVSGVARPLLITEVCMYVISKALCPYVLDARLRL